MGAFFKDEVVGGSWLVRSVLIALYSGRSSFKRDSSKALTNFSH